MRRPLLFACVLLTLSATSLYAQPAAQPLTGDPLPGLNPTELARYNQGRIDFNRAFNETEGLGPGFNQTSCGNCHNQPQVGGSGSTTVTRFGAVSKGSGFDDLGGEGGSLLQAQSINMMCQEFLPPAANVTALRITPLSVGLGLIEGIPDSALEAIEMQQATEGLVSGAIHWVQPLEDPFGPLRAGRFGWKAQIATVLSFSGDATLNEMGITNSLIPDENAPNGDPALLAACDSVADPEDNLIDSDGRFFIDRITDFQRLSAGPPQTPKSGMTGETVFNNIGCATCHISDAFVTGTAPEAALSGISFKPYSDFLLHNMGTLGDGIEQGAASGADMRTPTLWGVADRDPLMHDGRVAAGTFESRMMACIDEHVGEASFSRDNFNALSPVEKEQLINFLGSLGQLEFDFDDNKVITEVDFVDFWGCFTGPGDFYTPDDACSIHDIDQDGDVDTEDYAAFSAAFQGNLLDCNNNSVPDMDELVGGTAIDCNGNAIPDECDVNSGFSMDMNANTIPDECDLFLRGDCNSDTNVDIADAVSSLAVLFSGEATICLDACDINDDGTHNIADPIYLVAFLFDPGNPAPAAPYPACGFDSPGADGLSCFVTPCP